MWLQISLRSCLLCTYMIDKKYLIYLLDCLHQSLILHLEEICPGKLCSLFFLYIQNIHSVFMPLHVLRQEWQHFMEISKSLSPLQGLLAKNQKLRIAEQCCQEASLWPLHPPLLVPYFSGVWPHLLVLSSKILVLAELIPKPLGMDFLYVSAKMYQLELNHTTSWFFL